MGRLKERFRSFERTASCPKQVDNDGTVTADELVDCPDELQLELGKVIAADNLQELSPRLL